MTLLARARSFLQRGDLFQATLTLVGGTGAAQLIVIVTSPILTRLYTPADYGIYTAAVAILIISAVTCLRYDFAIPLPDSDQVAADVLGAALVANVVMSMLTGVGLYFLGPWVLAQFGAQELGPYVPLLVLAQFSGGVVGAFTGWAIRTKDFKAIAANRIRQSTALVIVQLGLGFVAFGAAGLLIGTVVSSLAGSSGLLRSAWRRNSAELRRITRSGVAAAANRYRRFPIYSSWSVLLQNLGLRAPVLLLVAFYGPTVGGQYALAERLIYLPLRLIAGAVGQVFVSEGAVLARRSPDALPGLFRRTTWNLARVGILPAIALAIGAPLLTGIIFGRAWQEAGVFVTLLVPMFYFAFIFTATGDSLNFLERQDLHLVREVLRVSLLGGSVIAAEYAGLPAVGVVATLGATGAILYVLYGGISWWAIKTYKSHPLHATAVPGDSNRLTEDSALLP